MKIIIGLLVAAALGLVINLVSNFLAPKAEKRKKLVWGIFAALIGLSVVLIFTTDNSPNGIPPEELQKVVSRILAENSKLAESLASSREEVGQLKERVTSALQRVQEAENRGSVKGLIKELQKSGDTQRLLQFLVEDRNKLKNNLVERNREIATIAYLRNDMNAAAAAIDELLQLQPEDLDALSIKANILWLKGGVVMENLFKQILEVATKKNDLEAQAGALANLGELYWGSAGPLPRKSIEMFKAKELEKQWAEERGMPYYDPLPEHVPPLVNKGNLI
jgi:hypothetical protein